MLVDSRSSRSTRNRGVHTVKFRAEKSFEGLESKSTPEKSGASITLLYPSDTKRLLLTRYSLPAFVQSQCWTLQSFRVLFGKRSQYTCLEKYQRFVEQKTLVIIGEQKILQERVEEH